MSAPENQPPTETRSTTQSRGIGWAIAFLLVMVGVIAAAIYTASVVNQNRGAAPAENAPTQEEVGIPE